MRFQTSEVFWAIDTEYRPVRGGRVHPVCLVAKEIGATREYRLWLNDGNYDLPQELFNEKSVWVVYYATAELHALLALSSTFPKEIIDLYAEVRVLTNGLLPQASLINACKHFNIQATEATSKEEARRTILSHQEYTLKQRDMILEYCASDVRMTEELFTALKPKINFQSAILRGSFTKSITQSEDFGIPINVELLNLLNQNFTDFKEFLIKNIDLKFGVYEGMSFKYSLMEDLVKRKGWYWPRGEEGKLKLDKSTFKEMAKMYPELVPLKDLRATISGIHLSELPVGPDERIRCPYGMFASLTGRNQPRGKDFIFAGSSWLRTLMVAPPGKSIVYVDYNQQEIGIAASLSRDKNMLEAFNNGDFYLNFGIQTGEIPIGATKQSHPKERDKYKLLAIAILYGMGEWTLAKHLGTDFLTAKNLMRTHQRVYPCFWNWIRHVKDYALLNGHLESCLGWKLHVTSTTKPGTLSNFLMQGNAAELMRICMILSQERGFNICAPVHDAFLIEVSTENSESDIRLFQNLMTEAGSLLFENVKLRTEAETFAYPTPYWSEKGRPMWNHFHSFLRLKSESLAHELVRHVPQLVHATAPTEAPAQ